MSYERAKITDDVVWRKNSNQHLVHKRGCMFLYMYAYSIHYSVWYKAYFFFSYPFIVQIYIHRWARATSAVFPIIGVTFPFEHKGVISISSGLSAEICATICVTSDFSERSCNNTSEMGSSKREVTALRISLAPFSSENPSCAILS
mmetsp:Transcript_10641/g.21053  ORF Transcript_10641/g.21053 Transcript_10641/m.21053 type:complete len:146 (-) Transcript_10641:3513-3950(-)